MLRLTGLGGMLVVFAPFAVFAQQAKPVITGVANVASYASSAISPGEMLVIFGTAMGPTDLKGFALDSQGRVTTTLSDVQVLFDGTAAPLVYVSESQIAVMAPYGIAGKSTTQVQVVYKGVGSAVFPKTVAQSAPGIFTTDASGKGQAATTNSDGSLNSPANPAVPGSWVTFYITGEGPTDPPGSDGNVAASTANVLLPVTVRIAGRTAQLLYAGSAPGNVNGFAQVNAVIPLDLEYGGNLPLVVQIGDASSQAEVTIAVFGPSAPVPGAPQTLSAVPNSSGQIVLAWTTVDTLATRFHLERRSATGDGFVEIANLLSSTTTFNDQNVTAGVLYQYRIRAECDWGYSAFSAVASGTVPVAQLMPPSNVQAVAASQTQINLTWSNANTNATRFQIERKTGAAGVYSMIATVPNTATSYPDATVVPGTVYSYRMRSEGASGLSAYSNETSATTPAVPLPPAPVVQATAISSSQIRLTWSTSATAIVRFRIERRTATTAYAEINQPGATSTVFDDVGLIPATAYLYRMRVETGAGVSPYSGEVTATTLQGFPAAPTNLRATATSSSQVSLMWTNNATDATAVRVESRPAGSATFTDIGIAATLTSTGIVNLQPNTAYTFRVRAQSSAGYSGYSNEATVTTLSVPKTVFLIHGLSQDRTAMNGLYGKLTGPLGIDQTRFRVDAGFDFSECANVNFCDSSCSITSGAQKLARYINSVNPLGDIVLVGFSMGGLIARDMIANNWSGVLNTRKVAGLITLGTPNAGYPFTSADRLLKCTPLILQMDGNWRSKQSQNIVVLSDYLLGLHNQWSNGAFPGTNRTWLAASGRSCSDPTRYLDASTGCRDRNPYSDGVVCDDSATLNMNTSNGSKPNRYWQDPGGIYVHSHDWGTSFVLCGNSGDATRYPLLSNPPAPGPLFTAIREAINGL